MIALALLAVTVHVVVFQGERREAQVLSERLSRVRGDINRLSRENERLRHLIINIRQSDDQVEKIGREDFGYIKSGEVLYFFEAPRQELPAKPAAPSRKKPKAGPDGGEPKPEEKVTPRAAGIIPEDLSNQLRP